MSRLAVAWVIAAAACSSETPPPVNAPIAHGSAAPIPAALAAPVTFAPSGDPARRYNEPLVAPPRTPLGDAVSQALEAAAGRARLPTPIADARLFRACEELAEVVPEEGVIDNAFVELALQRNGIIEPAPHLLVVWGDPAPDAIIGQIQPRLGEILGDGATARFGIGVAARGESHAIVIALQGSGITTAPIARVLPRGGAAAIEAVVDGRYKDPEVFVTHDDDGTTEHVPLALGRAGGFTAEIACGARAGRQQIEISADDARGATVLANFPVWCAAEPPDTLTLAPSADDADVTSPDEAERRMFALVNRDRAAAHLPPLVWDDRVARVARTYAEEMRTTKVVAHVSPTSGTAVDRLHAANIHTSVVLENVARAYGAGEAHAALMNSPGHRANVLSPVATHIGIGIALGDEENGRHELFVAQMFIRIPPKIDPPAVIDLVRGRIAAVRPVVVDSRLGAIAQQLASGLAAGKSRDALWPTAKGQLDQLADRYTRVGSVITALADVDAIDGAQLLGELKPSAIGIGIAQGTHPDIGDGAIWLVVLAAESSQPVQPPAPAPKSAR